MPNLPKTLLAVVGTAITAAIAYPPSRKQVVRTARATVDELLLRTDIAWTADLVLLTSDGHKSRLPRTSVLNAVAIGGDMYVVPWSEDSNWLHNVKANPDVVIDDRVRVRRARAEVVEGDRADEVREAFLEKYIPGPLRGILGRPGALLGPGKPVVRLDG